jgi:hypothetical protein
MDINISQRNYKILDESIDKSLLSIGTMIYREHLINKDEISYDDFMENFLRKTPVKVYKHKPETRIIPEEERCVCRIWKHLEHEFVQCNRKKVEYSRFCKIHNKKRNYGEINK